MKLISLTTLLGFTLLQANAQITISGNDLPHVNTPYLRDNAANPSVIDVNQTGANVVWDYSSLTSSGIDTIIYNTVASTNFAYQLYFNNPFSPDYDSDLAIAGADFPSIPGSPITVTNVINYFKIAGDGYYQTGFGATISGIPASVKYTPRDKVLPLPCSFGANETNPFEWLFQIPSVGAYGQQKTRTVEVDGWGTLLLPGNQSINALRVKSIAGTDTIYIDQFSFGFSVPSTQIDYKWYANGEGEPVLSVNTSQFGGNTQITGAQYKHVELNGISQKKQDLHMKIFPNPASNQVLVQLSQYLLGPFTIEIFDYSGKLCGFEKFNNVINQNIKINTTQLADGLYNVRLTSKDDSQTTKLLIKN